MIHNNEMMHSARSGSGAGARRTSSEAFHDLRAQDVPGRGAGLVRRQGADGVAVGRHGRRRGHRRGHATSGRRGQHAGAASELQQGASNQPARRDLCRRVTCMPVCCVRAHSRASECGDPALREGGGAVRAGPSRLFQTRLFGGHQPTSFRQGTIAERLSTARLRESSCSKA